MSTAHASASPKSVKIGTDTLTYGPLTYESRGRLEHLFWPVARSPLDQFEAMLEAASPEDIERFGGEEWVQKTRARCETASKRWEPDIESPEAEALFLRNLGRPEGDDRDYPVEFLMVVFGQRHREITEQQCAEYRKKLTKAQMQDIWNLSMEVGPYRPKSENFPVGAYN